MDNLFPIQVVNGLSLYLFAITGCGEPENISSVNIFTNPFSFFYIPFQVSHLHRSNQDPPLHHPIEPLDHYSVTTTQRIPPHPHQQQHHAHPRPAQQSSSLSSGKHVKLKPADLGYNNYYQPSNQQPKSAPPKPLDYQKLNNHTSTAGGPAGILKNNHHATGGHSKQRRPLIYELKQYEYFNSNDSTGSKQLPAPAVKNTNSVLQQHYSGHNYNINYNLNFTKNQYNILISPPTTTAAGGQQAPPYDENNHFISSHYQQSQQQNYQNNARNYKNNNANRHHQQQHSLYSNNNHYNQYLSNQHQQQHHSSKQQQQHQPAYLDEKPPLFVDGDHELGKMQREEIIIEHSQLVGDGSGPGIVIHPAGGGGHPAGQGGGAAGGRQPLLRGKGLGGLGGGGGGGGKLTAINRSHHFTQVSSELYPQQMCVCPLFLRWSVFGLGWSMEINMDQQIGRICWVGWDLVVSLAGPAAADTHAWITF